MNNLQSSLKRNFLWVLFAVFFFAALYTHDGEPIFVSDGPYGLGKPLIWLIWIGFFCYTISISTRENFFSSLRKLHPFLWHRQIGLDLYIGLLIPLTIIYLNEASIVILLLWLLPVLVFANLATLLYLALNYDALIAHFLT